MQQPGNDGLGEPDVTVPYLIISEEDNKAHVEQVLPVETTRKTVFDILSNVDLNLLLQVYNDSRKGSLTQEGALRQIGLAANTHEDWTTVASTLLGKMLQAGTPTDTEEDVYATSVMYMLSDSDSLEVLIEKMNLIKSATFHSQVAYDRIRAAKNLAEQLIEDCLNIQETELSPDIIERLLQVFAGSKRFQVREFLIKMKRKIA